MYRFIKKISVGLVIVVIFDFALGKALETLYFNQSSGFQHRTTFSIEKANQDILIFGSSRANHHYRPDIFEDTFNQSCYNTGREGQFIFYQTAVLKSILKRHTPKTIIYDFTGSFAYNQSDYDKLSSLLPYYKNHEEIREIVNLRSKFEKIKNFSKIYPYNSTILNILNGNINDNQNSSDENGYQPLASIWSKKLDSVTVPDTYSLDREKVIRFKEFVKLAKEHNIELHVIYSPVFYMFKTDYSIEVCKEICEDENVNFLNFSKDTRFLNKKHFFSDVVHLNGKGAEYFSKIVADTLLSNIKYKTKVN